MTTTTITRNDSTTIDTKELKAAMSLVKKFIPTRPSLPMLAGVKISAREGRLWLEAFDWENSVGIPLNVTGGSWPGAGVLVNARFLADIVAKLKPATTTLTYDGVRMQVAGFDIPTFSIADYPPLPNPQGTIVAYPVDKDRTLAVIMAAGRDESLPMLTGVKFEANKGFPLTVAATDRYRLHVLNASGEELPESQTGILPHKILKAVLSAAKGNVTISFPEVAGERLAVLHLEPAKGWLSNGANVTIRQLDAQFPKYRQLLPESSDIVARVNNDELGIALDLVALAAERHAPVRLTLTEGKIKLKTGSGDEATGEAEVNAKVIGVDGSFEIAFNPAYLLDALKSFGKSQMVSLAFTAPTRPAVITFDECPYECPDYKTLLMPVRLTG